MTATPTSSDLGTQLREVVSAVQDRKAVDLKVLYLGTVSDFTEYFVICSGTSERQVQAIADAVIDRLRQEKTRPLGVEGYDNGRWILIDCGALVAHIFEEETRDFYGLEKLWADGSDVTASFLS